MAYNPFDDVIENDPAYMQTGGELQRSILPQRRVNYVDDGQSERMAEIARGPVNFIGDIFAQTIGRIAENMVNPEAAERGRQKNEINKEIANYYNVVPQQITPAMNEDYFKKFGKEYQQLNFQEGINSGLNFFLEDAIKGSQAIQSGEKRFTDLPGNQKLGVGLLPLEFWLGGFGRKAAQGVGNEVLSKYKDMPLGELVANPQARQEIPEVVAEVENQYPILKRQTGPRETTERPSDMDLVASQSDSLDDRSLRFKTGMPNKSTLEARTKIDNFLNKLDSKQTTTAPEIAKETGVPYIQVDSLIQSFNYKNNPKIVKSETSAAPLFLKKYKLENNPKSELPATATYLRDMSSSFNKKFGKEPTAPELQLFIKQTETNPEIVEYFSKDRLANMGGLKNYKDQIGISAAQRPPIKNIVQEEISKNTPEGIQLKNALDLTEQQLKKTNAKQNEFSLAYNRNKDVFEPVFGSGKSGKANYKNYMQRERGVERRMDRLDQPGSPIPQQSAKKIQRAEQQLNFMLESKPNAKKNQKYGTGIDRSTPMFRFLTQKYRGMINDKGDVLNPENFMDNYVMPFKGNTKEETIANLAQEYNKKIGADDIEEFNEFLKVDNKYLRLRDLTESLMDELELSGKYTDEQLEQINLSIRPNFGHAYPIKKTNAKGRFEGLSSDARFLRAQPAVYNVSYQNTLDGTMQKVIDNVNKPKNIQELRVQKPKIITPEKNLEKVGVFIDIKDYDNQLDYLTALAEKVDQAMIDKGLISILAQSKKSKNVLDVMKKNYEDKSAAYFFGGPEKSPEEYMKIIRENLLEMGPDLKYVKENNTGRVGGKRAKPMVRMAMGGDPLQNINQQQFSPDPAIDQDYFQEAVDSGNLQAFNPTKIFRLFQKTDAVYTPKKLPDAVDTQQIAPPGTTLPTTQTVQPEDFAFQSFTLNKINDAQAPRAGTPEAWKQYLYGGGQGGKAPESEMFDSGLEQYLNDFTKYYPNQKITKQQLNDYYEMSPIGNIEIKVKGDLTNEEITNPGYREYVGGPRHRNQGNQPLDEVGTNYREIVVNSGPLPGDKKPFVESGHFNEKNVLGFTRVANYTQPDGKRVAVIQEMQTDMLTKVRKEQERLQALLKRIENIKATANREIQTGDTFRGQDANRLLDSLNAKIPPAVEQSLIQNADLIKPFPNEAARSTIPDYQKQLTELQSQIDSILSKDIKQSNPETGFTLKNISDKQQVVLDNLMDLNRSGQLDDLLKGIDVPATKETDELRRYAEDPNVRYIEDGLNYRGTKKLELFPPIPFNKQADYVDLLLKATIKDAQSRGIQKVAIYPSDLVNQRWGKNPDSDAGKKFKDLYGKVAIQQMKNIAKKYGGTAKVETVMNPNLSDRGLTYYKRNLEGEYEYLKQDQLAQGLEPEEAQLFINEQLKRNANTLGANQVIYSREIAPGQTMDYYVQPKTVTETTDTGRTADFEDFELVPLGPGDDRNAAQVLIEEYDPREIQMFTITLDSDKAQKPMFMFKKKSGGTIAKDSLLSITDIYGEYGR